MKHAGWLIGISCAVGMVSAGSNVFAQTANQVAQQPESQWSTIQNYCFGCHNEFVKAGNLFLNQLSAIPYPNTQRSSRRLCANCAGARCRRRVLPSLRSRRSTR